MMRVVDTNVLVSSLIRPGSVPDQVVAAWQRGRFRWCLSEPVFEEIREVLRRPHLRKRTSITDSQVERLLEGLRKQCEFVTPVVLADPVIVTDPDDDMVLATALAAKADAIVTGDKALRALVAWKGIDILTPAEIVARLKRTRPLPS